RAHCPDTAQKRAVEVSLRADRDRHPHAAALATRGSAAERSAPARRAGAPAHALSSHERERIVLIANAPRFTELPPRTHDRERKDLSSRWYAREWFPARVRRGDAKENESRAESSFGYWHCLAALVVQNAIAQTPAAAHSSSSLARDATR